ncbi:MAG: 1-acyl-sn-glycerol-3-phosphate acyltransferase [Bacteroidota bacterium]|nr:1-acyl-sn-glycerol-3-phosphate acyltransferase [Bacteroidota bacterium]
MKILGAVFYRYLWVVFNIFLAYFYRYSRKNQTTGMENVPNDRPVLLCSNHANAFMDALMLGCTVGRRTWFLARSDVFRKKMLANFLSFVGIIPIYRLLEGAENLSKNDETFEKCTAMLEENKAIMIFSEGLCIQERRLRKLKKGTARIAFSSEEKNDFKLNLAIVPVGMNYSATPWKFRKGLHIRFGKPIAVKDYEELYRKDKARAINLFTKELEERMAAELIIIDNKDNDALVTQLEEMFIPEWAGREGINPHNQKRTHRFTQQITHFLKEEEKENPGRIKSLREKAAEYFAKIKSLNVREWVVRKKEAGKVTWAGVIFNYFIFLLFSPAWLFGVITNYIPYKIPSVIADKIVKHIEWHASINATMGVFLWQIYWLLQSLVVALVFRDWIMLWSFMLAVPLAGLIAQELYLLLKKTNGSRRFLTAEKSAVEELVKTRKEIVAEVEMLRRNVQITDVQINN